MASKRLPCQVCGRRLTLRRDGLVKPHKHPNCPGWEADNCDGVGYRHARWPVGQHLRHHAGSVWTVVEDRGGRYGDYLIRCVIGTKRRGWIGGEEAGRETVAHGDYMHRHGWTPIDDVCLCGHGFDCHDHRLINAPCRDCEEPYECSNYEPDLTTPTQHEETP